MSCEVICTDNGKDGVEILEKFRGDERLKKVSVMMLTATNGIENLKKVI